MLEHALAAGERLLVHAGHVGVIEPSIGFDIQMVKGFRNILFGGEGLFLASLTGPGKALLQTMPIMNLAEEIARYLPGKAESAGTGAAVGGAVGGVGGSIAGALLGGLLGGSNSSDA